MIEKLKLTLETLQRIKNNVDTNEYSYELAEFAMPAETRRVLLEQLIKNAEKLIGKKDS